VRDLLIEAFATRMTQGHPAAVPRMQAVITALRTDSDIIEPKNPLAVLGCHAADELWEHSRRREMLERLEAHDRTHALFNALRMTLYGLAVCDLLAGQFQDADARYAEAAELTVAVGLPSMGTTMETELMAWRGQEVAVRASAELILQVWCHQLGVWSMAGFAYLSLLTLELSLGRYREALLIGIEAYQEDAPGLGNRILPDLVEAAVRAGDPGMAAVALARLTERAEASRTSWALGLLARCRALLAGDDQAEALYREALEHFASTALVTETARTHLLFGEWLRRRRRRGDARNELRIAHSLFEEMGAVLFADRARVELRATGEHARKRTQQTGHGLTAQETQIAGLAARGATNTEIATRLFITASTVEYHLNKIFRKLDLTSRRQLPQALRDQPPETVGG
jgi:DNA-binding CsgD family transcriptional regulator